MHIRKGGVNAADLLDPLIHQIHKRAAGARHILRQRNRGVRRVLQNQQMQQIPNRHLFFAFQPGRGCAAVGIAAKTAKRTETITFFMRGF